MKKRLKVISEVLGTIVGVATIIGSIYTVLSYYSGKSNVSTGEKSQKEELPEPNRTPKVPKGLPKEVLPSEGQQIGEKERTLTEFKSLINQSIVICPDKRNVAIVIESPRTEGGLSPENTLTNFLKKDRVNIVDHYFKEAFKTKGYFREIHGGNTEILRQSDALSKIDYIMIGKIDYTFRKGSQIDRDLVSCNISFNYRVINKKGDTIKSDSLNVVGPGFSEDAALERGLEILAERYSDRIMKPFL
jgi:hypothetical protein